MREKLVHKTKSTAGGAFLRIAARLDGADVPLIDMEPKTGLFSRLKEMVGMNGRNNLMHELIRWFCSLTKRESEQLQAALSKDTAKQRLKLVLIQDRLELAPDKLEEMKKEIWNVVSKYMVVNEEFMEFDVRRLDELTVLVSNI